MPPGSPPTPRRPLPQPVEQTQKSNRASRSGQPDPAGDASTPDPVRRALPQPVEMTSSTSRKVSKDARQDDPRDASAAASRPARSLPQSIETDASSSKSRRFLPDMVESSRRSRKNTRTSSGALEDKSNESPPAREDPVAHPFRRKRPDLVPGPPDNSPLPSTDRVPQVPPESKFSSSKLAEKVPRRHSFRIPELPSIRSTSGTEEDSNASDVPSLSKVSSAESDPAQRANAKRRKKTYPISARDTEDERFSGYLLTLAANAAEKQLRDQAMAAYPNENVHEYVDHYAVDRDSDEESDLVEHTGKLSIEVSDDEGGGGSRKTRHIHRESAAGWDMTEMRQHQAKLEEQKEIAWAPAEKQPELGRRKSIQQDAVQVGPPQPPKDVVGWQKDNEINPMRKAAAPPMAGQDLRFPKCQSPRQTRVDPQNYPGARKSSSSQSKQHTGLWQSKGSQSRKTSSSGLWMGVNAASAQAAMSPPRGVQSGLITPNRERTDPFVSLNTSASPDPSTSTMISSPAVELRSQSNFFPPTPPPSQPSSLSTSTAATKTSITDETLASEFSDTFITQLYNYLSLGYPVLARPYDPELSRITRVSIEKLRKDDANANARGYLGVPEGTGEDARGSLESPGERWKALRLYVWEWGRQQKSLWDNDAQERGWGQGEASYETGGGWVGTSARKGSWAW